jgi:DNA-binding transcriptional MerR regulator
MDKSPDAFRTISEVSEDLDIPQHVLRFWETRFNQIKPLKRGGGRRYYRPDDVDLLRGIRHLLYGQGYTIRGVQRILKEQGLKAVQSLGRGEITAPPPPSDVEFGAEDEVSEMGGSHDEPEGDQDDPPARAVPGPQQSALPLGDEGAYMPSAPQRSHRPAYAEAHLPQDAVRRLGNALAELEECRRLLSVARGLGRVDPEPA